MRFDTVLWDFDGTLVDTSPGIMESIRHACSILGRPAPDDGTLRKFIGPPLYFSFQEYAGYPPEVAEEATRLFRAHYLAGGVYHSEIYPGMAELLQKLCRRGAKNAVTTLKPENTARLLLERFGIDRYITVLKGNDPNQVDNHKTKAQMVGDALKELEVADRARAVLVGDTVFDEQGARESGVAFVAAAYGAGFEERPDCLFYAESVDALGDFLL